MNEFEIHTWRQSWDSQGPLFGINDKYMFKTVEMTFRNIKLERKRNHIKEVRFGNIFRQLLLRGRHLPLCSKPGFWRQAKGNSSREYSKARSKSYR